MYAAYKAPYEVQKAAEHMPEKPILLARPVQGEVDHEAEIKDIMKRFPKTIEYLAR